MIKPSDRLPPHVEEGVIVSIKTHKTARDKEYAYIIIRSQYMAKKEEKENYLKFYFSPVIWKIYKNSMCKGDFWRFHFYLKGNFAGNRLYVNCEVVKGVIYKLETLNKKQPPPHNNDETGLKGDFGEVNYDQIF